MMEQQDNLPIGIAQEPVEEARHPPVRTLPIYTFIIRLFLVEPSNHLYFIYLVIPPKIKITAKGSDVASSATNKAK